VSDWRAENAKRTKGAVLAFKKYVRPRQTWDHDHCTGCWKKFMESGTGALTEGYMTADGRDWICTDCFKDLEEAMEWKLAES
jgi:predicted Fe-S protein YdhL (DUF1289 family)